MRKMYSLTSLGFCRYIHILTLFSTAQTLLISDTPSLSLPPAIALADSPTHLLPNHTQFQTSPSTLKPWPFVLESPHELGNLSAKLNLTTGGFPRPRVQYQCDRRLFSIEASDCRQAYQYLPSADGNTYYFGNRTATRSWDVPLPFRSISRK